MPRRLAGVARRAAGTSVTGVGVAVLTVALVAFGAAPAAARAPAGLGPPQALTVDGLRTPIGLGLTDVQFAWQVNDPLSGRAPVPRTASS